MARFNIKVAKGTNAQSDVERIRIGTHYDCLCQIDDPVAADFHARVSYEQGGFYVEDLGTSPGTFKNGQALKGKVEIVDGDVLVVGRTHVKAAVKDAEITLNASPKSFFFEDFVKEKRDKKDPTQILTASEEGDVVRWARSEVRFGRYAPMRAGNWFGLIGLFAVVVFGLLLSGPREQLSEPGDLHASHAQFFGSEERIAALRNNPDIQAAWIDAAQEEGCAVCHDSFGGTPMEKCATCHGALMKNQHPFSDVPLSIDEVSARVREAGHLERGWGGEDCLICHIDHQGMQPEVGVFVPAPTETAETCSACHDESKMPGVADITRALADIEPSGVPAAMPYDGFPHDAHMAIDCSSCHVYDEGERRAIFADASKAGDVRNHREFASIGYDVCMDCHSADANERTWSPESEHSQSNLFALSWHGAQDPNGGEQNCTQCHAAVYDVPLDTVDSIALADFLPFQFERRDHAASFADHGDWDSAFDRPIAEDTSNCNACHVDGVITPPPVEEPGVFAHGTHMAALLPGAELDAQTLSQQCAECHTEFAAGGAYEEGLAEGLYTGPAISQCGSCHTTGNFNEGTALDLAALQPANAPAATPRSNFPHGPHLTDAALENEELAEGCFSCHGFPEGGDLLTTQPVTFEAAKTCVQCHDDHRNVGGGEAEVCSKCHSGSTQPPPAVAQWGSYEGWNGDPAFWGPNAMAQPNVPARKEWPKLNDFEHSSPGHDGVGCAECHDAANISGATTLSQVWIPDESDTSCRECHVEQRGRFHWR